MTTRMRRRRMRYLRNLLESFALAAVLAAIWILLVTLLIR